jgi:hypothetical protein
MHMEGERQLQIGDQVELSDSTIYTSGVITEDLGPDYVRVNGVIRLGRAHTATILLRWTAKPTRSSE